MLLAAASHAALAVSKAKAARHAAKQYLVLSYLWGCRNLGFKGVSGHACMGKTPALLHNV